MKRWKKRRNMESKNEKGKGGKQRRNVEKYKIREKKEKVENEGEIGKNTMKEKRRNS